MHAIHKGPSEELKCDDFAGGKCVSEELEEVELFSSSLKTKYWDPPFSRKA